MNGQHAENAPAGSTHDKRQRRVLIGLALFFFAPLAASFFLYYGSGGWRPAHQVNRGVLVDPARPTPPLSLPLAHAAGSNPADYTQPDFLKHKWTLLYWGPASCTARCRTDLYNMRQVRTALNRDRDRVQRVFIAVGDCCDWQFLDVEHPDLITVRATSDAQALLAILPVLDEVPPAAAERIYVIDPLGNLMMS